MSAPLKYDPSAALEVLRTNPLDEMQAELTAARDEMFADAELLASGGDVPEEKQPLDAGFIHFPEKLLEEHAGDASGSLIGRIQEAASVFRDELDRVVLLGIGGSYMGAKALFEALLSPLHNELTREQRTGTPRIYFEGNNLDHVSIAEHLNLLSSHATDPSSPEGRWGTVVISKSGGTLETAAAFRIFRQALEGYYGSGSDAETKYIIPVTGEQGKLRSLSDAKGYPRTFPIPDGIGGRFSILTAVGLLPAAIMGLDIVKLLEGAKAMTDRLKNAPPGDNPALDYVGICHAFERAGYTTRVLSTWGARLESAGFWYDQLLSESLGKAGQGALPLTAVNTRDLHSRGQQHQEGKKDKIITNLFVDSASITDAVTLPEMSENHDQLNQHAGKSIPQMLDAAIQGTNRAYADAARPTADLVLPDMSEHALGQFFQMLMLATVVEGRLIGINPYGQPGVEAYKQNMTAILSGQ